MRGEPGCRPQSAKGKHPRSLGKRPDIRKGKGKGTSKGKSKHKSEGKSKGESLSGGRRQQVAHRRTWPAGSAPR